MCDIDWAPIFTNWVLPLVGSFGGVFLGYYLSIRYDKKKKERKRDEIVITIKKLINGELKQIKEGIKGYQEMAEDGKKQGKLWRPNIDLPTDGKDSVVYSGRFVLLDFEIQRKISHIYVVIERAQKILEKMDYIFIHQKDISEPLKSLLQESQKLDAQLKHLLEKIEELEKELPPVLNY